MNWKHWLLLGGSLIVGGVVIYAKFKDLLPWTGGKDPVEIGPHELVDLALRSTQYIEALTTAVFGGGVFVLSQQLARQGRGGGEQWQRFVVAVGLTMLVVSLAAGFVMIEALIEAAYQMVVLEKVQSMRGLRIVQFLFLLLGVIVIGIVAISDTTGRQKK